MIQPAFFSTTPPLSSEATLASEQPQPPSTPPTVAVLGKRSLVEFLADKTPCSSRQPQKKMRLTERQKEEAELSQIIHKIESSNPAGGEGINIQPGINLLKSENQESENQALAQKVTKVALQLLASGSNRIQQSIQDQGNSINLVAHKTDTRIKDIYFIREQLGTGAFKTAYKAISLATGTYKVFSCTKIHPNQYQEYKPSIDREFQFSQKYHAHQGVLQIDAVLYAEKEFLGHISEYCDGQTLAYEIQSSSPISRDRVLTVAEQLLSTLADLHKNGDVHNDIKPANIFLSGLLGRVKLGDLGACGSEDHPCERCGTFEYRDPYFEASIIENKTHGTPLYSSWRYDIFSTGMVLFSLMHQQHPYLVYSSQKEVDAAKSAYRDLGDTQPHFALIRKITTLLLNSSDPLEQLINSMINPDNFFSRPTALEALSMVQSIRNGLTLERSDSSTTPSEDVFF